MIEEIIRAHMVPALLVVFRIAGLAIYGPVLGSAAIPRRVKALMVLALGAASYPAVAALVRVHPVDSLWQLLPLVAGEAATGAIIGLLASIPLVSMQMGGLVASQQLGLGFGRFYLPAMDDEGDALEQLMFLLALAAFIVVGGVEQMVVATLHSYEYIGAGGFPGASSALTALTGLLGAGSELALRVAAPLLAIVGIESVALGFVGRTVPSVNILSVGFPLRLILGLGVLSAGIGVIHMAMSGFMSDALDSLHLWFTGSR